MGTYNEKKRGEETRRGGEVILDKKTEEMR